MKAANEIERLRAEIARLREWDPVINAVDAERRRLRAALERIAMVPCTLSALGGKCPGCQTCIARAALAGAERGEVPACESRCADERCRRTGDCQKPGNCIAPDQPGRSQPASVGHPVCQSCGAFVDSRGKCRIPEHNP
jgi:hypothetical protein